MAATTTDIIMQFIGSNNQAIAAECRSTISFNDKLAFREVPGFAPGFVEGRYFLIDSFKFGMDLDDGETGHDDPATTQLKGLLKNAKGKQKEELEKHLAKALGASASGRYQSWRSAAQWNKRDPSKPDYTARINDFSFTRRMDKASTSLFSYCHQQATFPFASVIKRRSVPVADSTLPENQAYLRFDFADVQIASLAWSDDDVVEETCAFRAKKMRAQFWQLSRKGMTADAGYLTLANKADWTNPATVPPTSS